MTIFITGASAGFGKALVRHFAVRQHQVIACARRAEPLSALAEEFPHQVVPLILDVRNRSAVFRALDGLPPDLRDIDVLINNAGLALGIEPAHEANFEDWETMIMTNCLGLVSVTHVILPSMVRRKKGRIINIGSIAGEVPYPGGNVYGATKAFVHQFTNNLNADLIGTGVMATSIEPGLCGGTEFSEVRFKGDPEKAAAPYRGVRPLSPQDIVDAVAWVVERPDHVTINQITLMPNSQSFAGLNVDRCS